MIVLDLHVASTEQYVDDRLHQLKKLAGEQQKESSIIPREQGPCLFHPFSDELFCCICLLTRRRVLRKSCISGPKHFESEAMKNYHASPELGRWQNVKPSGRFIIWRTARKEAIVDQDLPLLDTLLLRAAAPVAVVTHTSIHHILGEITIVELQTNLEVVSYSCHIVGAGFFVFFKLPRLAKQILQLRAEPIAVYVAFWLLGCQPLLELQVLL